MRWMRGIFGLVLALALFAMPAVSQTTDHNDTNSKTKKAMKKAVHKSKAATSDTADDTRKGIAEGKAKTEEMGEAGEKKTEHAAKSTKEHMTGDEIDVNSASKEQLMTLSGVGDAYAQKIIDNRPYTSKYQIVSKAGVPKATYEKIKGKIIAHQTAEQKEAKAKSKAKTEKSKTKEKMEKK